MDYCVGPDSEEQRIHCYSIRNIAVMIRDIGARIAVRIGPQVDHGYLCLGVAADDETDNMATQETASADNKDFA